MPDLLSVTRRPVSGSGTQDETGRRFEEIYDVEFDEAATHYEALRATGVPRLGDSHVWTEGQPAVERGDPYAMVRSLDAEPVSGNARLWQVRVEYNTTTTVPGLRQVGPVTGPVDPENPEPQEPGVPGYNDNPLMEPFEYSYGAELMQVPLDVDLQGDAVVNSAGKKFDPPATRDILVPVLTVSRWEALSGLAVFSGLKNFSNTVNLIECPDDVVLGEGEDLVKLSISANRQFKSGGYYWRVTYTLRFHTDEVDPYQYDPAHGGTNPDFTNYTRFIPGWQPAVLDAGYYEFSGAPGDREHTRILDNEDTPFAEPSMLDGAGLANKRKDSGVSGSPPQVFIPFQGFRRTPFNQLGLFKDPPAPTGWYLLTPAQPRYVDPTSAAYNDPGAGPNSTYTCT